MTEEQLAAFDAFSVALERAIKNVFGDSEQSIHLWLAIRDLPELNQIRKASEAAGRAQATGTPEDGGAQ